MTLRRLRHALLSCCSVPALQAFWVYALPDRRLQVPRDHEVVALWPGHVRAVPVRLATGAAAALSRSPLPSPRDT